MTQIIRPPSDIDLVFDFDGVICANNSGDYANAPPYKHAIIEINKAYDKGYHITIFTARYGKRAPGYQYQRGYMEAYKWLVDNGVKFHELIMGKPAGDLYVDDKACVVRSSMSSIDWDENFWPSLENLSHVNKYNMPIN